MGHPCPDEAGGDITLQKASPPGAEQHQLLPPHAQGHPQEQGSAADPVLCHAGSLSQPSSARRGRGAESTCAAGAAALQWKNQAEGSFVCAEQGLGTGEGTARAPSPLQPPTPQSWDETSDHRAGTA